ncbi:MAG TPA: hypothetical protein VJ770_15620, partial [Stellaceae bacterium]|nr:hypothetical protein [Stellaceae bacterium]
MPMRQAEIQPMPMGQGSRWSAPGDNRRVHRRQNCAGSGRVLPRADSDEVAQAIRDDIAQGSEMISPGSGASLAGIFLALAEGWSSVRAA